MDTICKELKEYKVFNSLLKNNKTCSTPQILELCLFLEDRIKKSPEIDEYINSFIVDNHSEDIKNKIKVLLSDEIIGILKELKQVDNSQKHLYKLYAFYSSFSSNISNSFSQIFKDIKDTDLQDKIKELINQGDFTGLKSLVDFLNLDPEKKDVLNNFIKKNMTFTKQSDNRKIIREHFILKIKSSQQFKNFISTNEQDITTKLKNVEDLNHINSCLSDFFIEEYYKFFYEIYTLFNS